METFSSFRLYKMVGEEQMRRKMITKKILVGKMITSIVSSILSTILILILLSLREDYNVFDVGGWIIIVVFVGILLYGVPISILIDQIVKNIDGTRRTWISLIYYLLFGFAFVFIISLIVFFDSLDHIRFYWNETQYYLIASIVAPFFFWLIEEFFIKRQKSH